MNGIQALQCLMDGDKVRKKTWDNKEAHLVKIETPRKIGKDDIPLVNIVDSDGDVANLVFRDVLKENWEIYKEVAQ